MNLENLFAIIFSYLIASIPFGLILSKLMGHGDLRKVGSGNIGATNALRAGGKKLGALTLLLDMIKGIVPLAVLKLLHFENEILAISGVAAISGHIFPIWLKFKGGKGVATTLAVLLFLTPYLGAIFIVMWTFVFYITKIVSISSLCATFFAVMVSFWCFTDYFIMYLVIFILMIFKHKDNIIRIWNGNEPKFK